MLWNSPFPVVIENGQLVPCPTATREVLLRFHWSQIRRFSSAAEGHCINVRRILLAGALLAVHFRTNFSMNEHAGDANLVGLHVWFHLIKYLRPSSRRHGKCTSSQWSRP